MMLEGMTMIEKVIKSFLYSITAIPFFPVFRDVIIIRSCQKVNYSTDPEARVVVR